MKLDDLKRIKRLAEFIEKRSDECGVNYLMANTIEYWIHEFVYQELEHKKIKFNGCNVE